MEKIQELAEKFDISVGTVEQLLIDLQRTEGKQVQFNIQELGGFGQWQANGMIMIGDMFNNSLKDKVNRICQEIAQHSQTIKVEKKVNVEQQRNATTKGSQNGMSYAYYFNEHLLEVVIDGQLKKYDTKDYEILGVQQSQNTFGQKLSFSHSKGSIFLTDLKEL